jgi:hypothetical protein
MISKDDKIQIINSKISILEGVIYNLDIELAAESAKSNPNNEHIQNVLSEKNDNLLALNAINQLLDIEVSE